MIAIDDLLIDHGGQFIKDVRWFWDNSNQRSMISQDYLIANFFWASGKHYPLEFWLIKKRESCQAAGEKFGDHTVLFCQLVDLTCERSILGNFAFNSYFTNAKNLNYIQFKKGVEGRPSGYVGDLKLNRKLDSKGKSLKAEEFAAEIPGEDREEIRHGDKRQWYFKSTVHIPKENHKIRILILLRHNGDANPCKVLVKNKVTWQVSRILGV